jgi:transposase-like protein
MGKHHTEDYKLSAVKYALKTGNQVETCEVFDCKRSSLQEWITMYEKTGSVVRKTQKSRVAYKVKQEYINFLKEELIKKPDIFMADLKVLLEKKYPEVSLSREHIGKLLRDSNKTRKRLRKIHQPSTYRGKPREHKKEVSAFIQEARKYSMDKIICLDETAIYPALHPSYARCDIGKRCYVKTTNSKVFKHYSLLVAITNKDTIAYELYEQGAVNAERLSEFITKHIKGKYTDHLIVMDNAMFHKSPEVKKAVEESGNKILYSVAYYPRSNPIEQYFNQVKHYIKKESPISFADIKETLEKSIKQVTEKNYKNYFIHAFNAEWLKKNRKTRKRPSKLYKN